MNDLLRDRYVSNRKQSCFVALIALGSFVAMDETLEEWIFRTVIIIFLEAFARRSRKAWEGVRARLSRAVFINRASWFSSKKNVDER